MIVKSILVQNFRSIKDETLDCNELTALVGANGSGKSSFLYAMRAFYDSAFKLGPEDFYNNDLTKEIIVLLTFYKLSDKAKTLFSKYIQNDELIVKRIFKLKDDVVNSKFYGLKLQNPDFVGMFDVSSPVAIVSMRISETRNNSA